MQERQALMGFIKELFWHLQHSHLHLGRFAEQLNARNYWHEPVKKLKDTHVSGDALAEWRFDGMPLPNIWKGEK